MNVNTYLTDFEQGLLIQALLGLGERQKEIPGLAEAVAVLATKLGVGIGLGMRAKEWVAFRDARRSAALKETIAETREGGGTCPAP